MAHGHGIMNNTSEVAHSNIARWNWITKGEFYLFWLPTLLNYASKTTKTGRMIVCKGTIHILCQHMFGTFSNPPIFQHKYCTEHQQKWPFFEASSEVAHSNIPRWNWITKGELWILSFLIANFTWLRLKNNKNK